MKLKRLMKRPLKKNRLVKILLVVLILFVFVPAVGVVAFGGINYLQAKNLVAEGNSLSKVENYDQAVEDYALAQAKWLPSSFKSEINSDIVKAQKLKEEKDNYNNGIQYFNDEKWQSAKDLLSKITDGSKYYQDAHDKLASIEARLKVANQPKTIYVTSTQTQNTSNPDKDSLCRNNAELYSIQQQNYLLGVAKDKQPQAFWSDAQIQAVYGWDWQQLKSQFQAQYSQIMTTINNAVQQIYLLKYNECLTQ